MTDILCVNETEAQLILGQDEPLENPESIEEAMELLLLKCHTIVVTLGSKGAALATRDQRKPLWIRIDQVEKVVDTTGAGDSFVGSMAYYLSYYPDLDLASIVTRSCAVASLTVQKEGTQTSFPYRHELPNSQFFQAK